LFGLLLAALALGIGTPRAQALIPPADFYGMTTFGQLESDAEAAEIQRLGIHRVRVNMVWRDFQQSNCNDEVQSGVSFAGYDKRVRRAAEHNITIIADLYGTRQPTNCNGTDLLHQFPKPGSSNLYKDFVVETGFVWQVVQRYGVNGSFWYQNPDLTPHPIKIWEVWNETNFAENNPGGVVSPQSYAKLLIDSAKAIRGAQEVLVGQNPWNVGTRVLFGGLWGDSLAGNGATVYWTLDKYLQEIYTKYVGYSPAEVHAAFDGLSYHPYALRGNYNDVINTVGGARAVLNNWGDTNKDLWLTEIGWPVGFNQISPSLNAAQQADYLNQSLNWIYANQGYLRAEYAAAFVYQDIPPACNTASCWAYWAGIRDVNGNERPAWCTMANLVAGGSCEFAAPAVVTRAATEIKAGKATVSGTVNARGLNTTYRFEYGTTTGYGSSFPVPDESAGNAMGSVTKTKTITGLLANTTYHFRIRAQNAAGVSYGADLTFKTGLRSTPSVLEQASGNREIFYRGSDGRLHFWNWNAAKGTWSNEWLGAENEVAGNPVAAQQSNGDMQIYYRGTNGQLRWWYWNAAKGNWSLQWLGATNAMAGDPDVVTRASGDSHIFYRGTDGRLSFWNWHAAQGTWSLESLGATQAVAGNPDAIVLPNGDEQIYYRSSSGQLQFWYWNAAQANWSLQWLGATGAMAGDPEVMTLSSGDGQIFYRATNGSLTFWYWNAAQGNWSLQWLGAANAMAGDPDAVVLPNGDEKIVYRSSSGTLTFWRWYGAKGTWALEWLGGANTMGGEPTPVVQANGEEQIYYGDPAGVLNWWWWHTATATWSQEWLAGGTEL
jgi:hypothetical protein